MSKYIFISYSHKDEKVANDFCRYLEQHGFDVFLAGKTIKIGDKWADKITKALLKADYFIVLLSIQSMGSDMVTEEIRRARQSYNKKNIPEILPIRINLSFDDNINYDMAGYLNCFQQRLWINSDDTHLICNEIIDIINRHSKPPGNWIKTESGPIIPDGAIPVPNAPLEIPYGQVRLNSPFYVKRKIEDQFIENILEPGALLRIKAPRQYGKTSLLSRIGEFAKEQDCVVVSISLQQIDNETKSSLDSLLRRICYEITKMTGLTNKIDEYWSNEFLGTKGKCIEYIEYYVLVNVNKPIVFILDEADNLFDFTDVHGEFFSLLRYFNDGKKNELWGKFRMVISYSTEYHLTFELNQSPFNVGISDNLEMFTPIQIKNLSLKHNLKLDDLQLQQLMNLIGGHPFLIRMAFYVLAQGENFDSFMQNALLDNGPFHDHLIRFQFIFSEQPKYAEVFKQILANKYSSNILINDNLRAAGLIIGSTPNVKAAFGLYELFFKNKL